MSVTLQRKPGETSGVPKTRRGRKKPTFLSLLDERRRRRAPVLVSEQPPFGFAASPGSPRSFSGGRPNHLQSYSHLWTGRTIKQIPDIIEQDEDEEEEKLGILGGECVTMDLRSASSWRNLDSQREVSQLNEDLLLPRETTDDDSWASRMRWSLTLA